jgi:hypothetical protein
MVPSWLLLSLMLLVVGYHYRLTREFAIKGDEYTSPWSFPGVQTKVLVYPLLQCFSHPHRILPTTLKYAAIQQFGRSHRCNQITAPEYKLLISNIGGERRFCAAVAKRLQSLGALTQGDRHAATGAANLTDFDIDSPYGSRALSLIYANILRYGGSDGVVRVNDVGEVDATIAIPKGIHNQRDYLQRLNIMLTDIGIITGEQVIKDTVMTNVPLFLNRLFMLKLADQDELFGYFEFMFDKVKGEALRAGELDSGIADVTGNEVLIVRKQIIYKESDSGVESYYNEVCVEKSMSSTEAARIFQEVNVLKSINNQIGSESHPLDPLN